MSASNNSTTSSPVQLSIFDDFPKLRICPDCGITKELTEFYYVKKKYNSRVYYKPSYVCKKCNIARTAKWGKNNPEKYKKQKQRYYKKHSKKIIAKNSKWAKDNPDKRKEISTRYLKKNRNRLNKKNKQWKKDNPEISRKQSNLRRSRKKNIHTEDLPAYEEILKTQFNLCSICGRSEDKIPVHGLGYKWSLDHKIPITREGSSHTIDNIQVLCWECNSRKHTKTNDEFIKHICTSKVISDYFIGANCIIDYSKSTQ